MEAITGMGLATGAGFNKVLPILMLALFVRSGGMEVGESYAFMERPEFIAFLGVLLVIELAADKIPVLDNFYNVIGVGLAPISGAFVASASTSTIDPSTLDPTLITAFSYIFGGGLAGIFHGTKTLARPVINLSTAGVGGIFVSIIEDIFSFFMSLIALVLPVIALCFMAFLFLFALWVFSSASSTRQRRYDPRVRTLPPRPISRRRY